MFDTNTYAKDPFSRLKKIEDIFYFCIFKLIGFLAKLQKSFKVMDPFAASSQSSTPSGNFDKVNQDNQSLILNLARKHGLDAINAFCDFPKYFQIETTGACNARCAMCPQAEGVRETKQMSDEIFDKVVSELKPKSCWIEKVSVHFNGEPLLDGKLESRIRSFKDIGIRMVEFTSNASLMDEARAESVILSGVNQVTFSIDGATQKTFEGIRKGLKFDQCVSNIKNFIKIRDKLWSPLTIRIRMTVQKDNINEYEDFLKMWKDELGPSDVAYGRYLHNVGGWLKDYDLPQKVSDRELLNKTACPSPWTSLVVLSDGRISLCCCDYNARFNIGNIRGASIQDLWQSDVVNRIREGHLNLGRNAIKGFCQDCLSWSQDVTL